jgi:hypothetical protein
VISDNDVFLPSSHVAYRKIAGQLVIVQTLEDNMLTLNETGTEIWGMMDGREVSEVARGIAQTFQVSFEDSLQDVKEFFSDMSKRGLVELKSTKTSE